MNTENSGSFTNPAIERTEPDTPVNTQPTLQVTSINHSDLFTEEDCVTINENTIDELWMPIKVIGDEELHKGFRQKLRGDVGAFPFDKIREITKAANDQIYNFDLLGIIDQDFPQVYKYTEDCYYNYHIDINLLAPTRKMTWIVNLSDETDYEGGDITFMNTDTSAVTTKRKGSILIFPSFIPFQINKITKGEKKLIIGHVHGAVFR
jgi:PKHD-type hydroxylase|tara:strand:- start:805 stop:1425 length:621 start_codon:yes stop_codon:yes gene_type:complete